MRGNPELQNPTFFVANTEERLAKTHPLRAVKRRADDVLKQMGRSFDAAYSEQGRPSPALAGRRPTLVVVVLASAPTPFNTPRLTEKR